MKSSDFYFYFESSTRSSCYIAPERLLSSQNEKGISEFTVESDLFSLGCILFELMSPNTGSLFDLKRLYDYKNNKFDIEQIINNDFSQEVGQIISLLLSLDPEKRQNYSNHVDKIFPQFFYWFYACELFNFLFSSSCNSDSIINHLFNSKNEILEFFKDSNDQNQNVLLLIINILDAIIPAIEVFLAY